MSSDPFLVGIQGQGGSIHLLPVKPRTLWQRLEGWLARFLGWLVWTVIAFLFGYLAGAL